MTITTIALTNTRAIITKGKIETKMNTNTKELAGRYQYNLSDPMDKLNYDLDLKAKMNDELYAPITPNVDLDRGLGQYGGGMKPLFE